MKKSVFLTSLILFFGGGLTRNRVRFGPGDTFKVRVAGNIVNEDIAGSMEYAYKAAGSKVVLVMGHTSRKDPQYQPAAA